MWCVPSLDDEYVARMEDLLRLYARPLTDDEPVFCLDEKPVCLHAEKRHSPRAKIIHLVMDNLSTHSKKGLIDAFGQEEADALWARFKVHFTPKHGSWLNQAEIEISLVSRECLGKRRLSDLHILEREVKAWAHAANKAKRKIDWRFRVHDARKKFHYDFSLRKAGMQERSGMAFGQLRS